MSGFGVAGLDDAPGQDDPGLDGTSEAGDRLVRVTDGGDSVPTIALPGIAPADLNAADFLFAA